MRFQLRILHLSMLFSASVVFAQAESFEGRYFAGDGDTEYLRLLDISRRMFAPDPEYQNLSMLYTPSWNGLVEGPTWGAWWIQNSYGTTYAALPFLQEPFATFLQNSQDLWFDQMGDGKRVGYHDWVAPDGCLCDAASPGWIVYKQGDGRIDIHDWGLEFTAAGVLLQAELLLISRDAGSIAHYLPRLERCVEFVESRRDPNNNLFLAGPAANLLAPSYAGWKQADGVYGKAYLTGLSVTYIAALDRMIEVEKLAGQEQQAARYTRRRDLARQGLKAVTTNEGYFIKSLDPDGTRHGVYGAQSHGYFESSPNHDAIAFRVADEEQARRIYNKIASIPLLRRHDVIIANEPGLDDMYEEPTSWLWQHGTWVNGGHWSTCEARVVLAYFRLGEYEDARRSIEHMLTFARRFRLDNPLVNFGNEVYQPKEAVNLCYDSFGPMAAMVRGLFEYLYTMEELTLIPHIPERVSRLEQRFPIRFGKKRLYLTTVGQGPITTVSINGKPWFRFDPGRIQLPYDAMPDSAQIDIALGGAALGEPKPLPSRPARPSIEAEAVATLLENEGANGLPLRIGADSRGENRFMGDVADVRLYGVPLGDEQIAALANHQTRELPAPVAAWDFRATRDDLFVDVISESHMMKATEAVSTREGPHGAALHLEGNAWLETPHNSTLNLPGRLTIALWVKAEREFENGARLVDKIPAGTDKGYLLDLVAANRLRVITPYGTLTSTESVPANDWSHVAATFEAGGELKLYLNGAPVAAAPCRIPPIEQLVRRVERFAELLEARGLSNSYEGAHADLAVDAIAVAAQRQRLLASGALPLLPEPSRSAADQSYVDAAVNLCRGLAATMDAQASDASRAKWYECWLEAQ